MLETALKRPEPVLWKIVKAIGNTSQFLFYFEVYLFILGERESRGGAETDTEREREREAENPKQTPHCQHGARGRAQIHKP